MVTPTTRTIVNASTNSTAEASRSRRTASEVVTEALREAILRGILKGGQRLGQEELAAQFGVSRLPIREALRQLEVEGFVLSYPHRGVVVSTLTPEEVQEISEIRLALETLALRLTIPHLSEDVLQQADAILSKIDQETDLLGWSELNWQFHKTLYTPANRPRLLTLLKNLYATANRYPLTSYKAQSQQEHRKILEACRHRETETALKILEQHIEATAKMPVAYLKRENSEDASQEIGN